MLPNPEEGVVIGGVPTTAFVSIDGAEPTEMNRADIQAMADRARQARLRQHELDKQAQRQQITSEEESGAEDLGGFEEDCGKASRSFGKSARNYRRDEGCKSI